MPKLTKLTPIAELTADSLEWNMHIKLGEIMKAKKTRQYEMAKWLGVKQGTISNWKKGRTPLPSNYVYDICCYLDITPNILYGWEEYKEKRDGNK